MWGGSPWADLPWADGPAVAAGGGASLNLAASSLSIAGTVGATGDLQFGVGLNLSASALAVAGAVAVAGDIAYLVPSLDLSVSALALSGALAPSGDILAGTSFDLATSSLSLTGAASLAGDIQITTAVVLDLAASPLSISGAVLAAGDVAFGTSFDLAAGSVSMAGTLSIGGDISTAAIVLPRRVYKLDEQPQLGNDQNRMRIVLTEHIRNHAREINRLKAGFFSPKLNTATAAPTTGTWAVGDFIANEAPAELGTASSKYVIEGWTCIVSGTPGTFVEKRFLTGA